MAKSIIDQIADLERDAVSLRIIRNGLVAIDPECANVKPDAAGAVNNLALTSAGLSLVQTFQNMNLAKGEIIRILGCQTCPNNFPQQEYDGNY